MDYHGAPVNDNDDCDQHQYAACSDHDLHCYLDGDSDQLIDGHLHGDRGNNHHGYRDEH